MDKKFLMLGIFVGGLLGSFVPSLWGAGEMSFQGLLFGTLGSIVGLYFMFRWTRGM